MGASSSGRVCKKCNNAIALDGRRHCYGCYRKQRIKAKTNIGGPRRWQLLRAQAFQVIGNRCWRCRKVFAKRHLHLHHLHYGTVGKETLNNVLLLCRKCHAFKHKEMKAARERAENLD